MRSIAAVLSFVVAFSVLAQDKSIEWINSPQALFATQAERAEWFRLTSDAQREQFKKRYWDMRGEQFKTVILDRIRKADARFSIKDGAIGSETARGMVFIVFGPPAFMNNAGGGGVVAPTVVNGVVQPNSLQEGSDYATTWMYDTHRTPHLMEMLGRPELSIDILIEPSRRRDQLQTPGVVEHYREILAERSITNPAANVPLVGPDRGLLAARNNAVVPDAIKSVLRDAKPAATGAVTITPSDVWIGKPGALITVTVPNANETQYLTTYGEVRSGDRVVATIAEPFATSDLVSTTGDAHATAMRLDLPPGSYDAAFTVVDARNNKPIYTTVAPLHIADITAPFDVSSVVVGTEPTHGVTTPLSVGDIALRPRADRQFKTNESLWYSTTIHSANGAEGITAEVQLRHGGKMVAQRAYTPQLGTAGPDTFLLAEELPLARLEPGDYSLYLIVHGPKDATEVRRADFRVNG